MSNVNSASYPTAQVTPKSRFSLIWIIPITAALIGGWLIFKYYSERGTIITITFDAASGIEAKKTPIRFKDVQVGKVKKLSLTSDLKRVKVTAEIYPEMAGYLGNNTHFWVERPRVTFQGISGLDTLLSGVHIGIDPGSESPPLEHYIGLDNVPIVTTDKKGTRISLNTNSLGSLDIGSPVYYHKINVGEVTSYKLNPQDGGINVFIYIHEPYDLKIKTNTRFWNASGLELNLNASGVSARMESLTSLLIGGISFETPAGERGYELSGETAFKLYDSYKLANDDTQRLNKLFYVMYFDDSLHGLTKDSVIEYAGVKVGKIEDIILEKSENNSKVKTLVKVSLRIDKFSDKDNKEEAEQILRNLVADGLKAQLVIDSLITGAQYISLDFPSTVSSKTSNKNIFALLPTEHNKESIFPTTLAQTSLLSFDATEISAELSQAIASVTQLINSDDIKKTLEGLANTSESIGKITTQLEDEGFSGELVKTLEVAQQTTKDISLLIADTRKTMKKITHVSTGLQKDASQSMKTLNNVSNKLQNDISKTLKNIDRVSMTLDKGLKSTLSEDSALQYRLQQLINELSEAAKSFSVLADTIQRKPNSLIIGK